MKRILKEYGDKQTTRDKMAKAAKRSLERDGDDSTYHNAINSLTKRGSSREEMQDFQDKFEKNENINMKKQVKLSEADLNQVIKGAVESLLKEYTDFDKMKMYGRPNQNTDDGGSKKQIEDGVEDFNEQPVNDIATESRQYKVNESQLQNIIRESVNMILKEYGNSQVGQYQLGRLAARKKANGDEEGYKNVVNKAKLQWGADRGVGTNQNAFGNGMHVGKDNVKQGYNLAKKGKL